MANKHNQITTNNNNKTNRVEWGKTPPLWIVVFFFSETKVKCVSESYHSLVTMT